MVIREYMLKIGVHMVDEKYLSKPLDIFFLKEDEILYHDKLNKEQLDKIIIQRKSLYNKRRLKNNIKYEIINNKREFSGDCCVPGNVTGKIVKIESVGQLYKLEKGDILLCRHLRPAWSYVFSNISGVIVEEGGILSHGATLLREHSTPSIMNVKDIYHKINQHSIVELNCEKGLIKIV